MPNLNINTGTIRLTINDDPDRVITFNPTDVIFAERFYALLNDLDEKLKEYQRRGEAIDQGTATDDRGLPVNLSDRIAFVKDVCEYMHGRIDALFGAGTSDTVFQGVLNMDVITQFLEAITPYVQQAREAQVAPYRKAQPVKKAMQ
jgi:hypothetical protein